MHRTTPKLRTRASRLSLGALMLLGSLVAGGAVAQPYLPDTGRLFDEPDPWPQFIGCASGTNCWIPVLAVQNGVPGPVTDPSASDGDASKKSQPNPSSADFFYGDLNDGQPNPETAVYFAYRPDPYDSLYFRMRLKETPAQQVNQNNGVGWDNQGAFDANTAWNFILDLDGDGWLDYGVQVDGNTGTQQDRNDYMRVVWSDSTTSQNISSLAGCAEAGPGQQLARRKANVIPDLFPNDSPFTGAAISTRFPSGACLMTTNVAPTNVWNVGDIVTCTSAKGTTFLGRLEQINGVNTHLDLQIRGCGDEEDPLCDFGYTRTVYDGSTTTPATPRPNDFTLDMQFPRQWFDSCRGPDVDADSVVGEQVIYPDTPFIICATTSTQPNDFTAKDLAFNGAFAMDNTKPLPCSGPCTFEGGCSPSPLLIGFDTTCQAANPTNFNLVATVLDALDSTDGQNTIDTQIDVNFYYDFVETPTNIENFQLIGTVTSPTGLLNNWQINWNVGVLPAGQYIIKVVVTDDQGNVLQVAPFQIDIDTCVDTPTPVTLAAFSAERDGRSTTLRFTTETEVGNVGFNVYGSVLGSWRKLNDAPIPSHVVDSTSPQEYEFTTRMNAARFALEEIDLRGAKKLHGAFELGTSYGTRLEKEAIDWEAVRHELSRETTATADKRLVGGAPSTIATSVDLGVAEDGIYRVTYDDLSAIGVDWSTVRGRQIGLTFNGQPVPRRMVTSAKGGTFGPGSYVEFVGFGNTGLYSRTNVYRLVRDRKLVLDTPVDNAGPVGFAPDHYMADAVVERDRQYSFASPNGDPWYDSRLISFGGPSSASVTVELDHVATTGAPAFLSVDSWGMTSWSGEDPDHHLVVRWNGVDVADDWFDGQVARTTVGEIAPGQLASGTSTVEIVSPGDTGFQWELTAVDRFQLSYPREFVARDGELQFAANGDHFAISGFGGNEISAYRDRNGSLQYLAGAYASADGSGFTAFVPGGTVLSSVGRYFVAEAGSLRVPTISITVSGQDLRSGDADYVIVSHPSFIDRLGPLVSHHQSRGLSVRVVDVDAVYSEFGFGNRGPEAIRAYVSFAARELGARYVLLVGGTTYDPLDHLGLGSIDFVPTPYVQTGELVHFAPADPWFADVDGDGAPDLGLGRLPVRTDLELDNVIEKIVDYSTRGYGRTAIFASDRDDPAAPVSFEHVTDALVDRLPSGWTASRAYVGEIGAAAAKAQLIGAINAGVTLTAFMGHSGLTLWTFEGLFNTGDLASLTNAGSPTVVAQWGCWNTYYVDPAYQTLGHRLLLDADRGAAAVLGSTTLTDAASDDLLARWLVPRMTAANRTLGDAVTEAKQGIRYWNGDIPDILMGWTILGDPAMPIGE